MAAQETIVITISRQLGSGGAYLGQRLAERLGFKYLDREILSKAAESMGENPDAIVRLDEHANSIWDRLSFSLSVGSPEAYEPTPAHFSDYREVQAAEEAIIRQVAQSFNAVIIGRGGFHFLAGHPGNIRIFIHAPLQWRQTRLMDSQQAKSSDEAMARIDESDRMRERLVHSVAGKVWNDLRNYHLTLDTSAVGLDAAEAILVEFVRNSSAFKRVCKA